MNNPLNEATIKALPIPEKGNRVHYYAGAVLQGQTAPRGFGVRVTAGGAKAFVINFRLGGKEHRFTIGQYPDWSALHAVREARALRQRIDRGENPLADRAPAFFQECAPLVMSGRLKFREHLVNGLENAPSAFMGLLEGQNFGKLIVRVSKDPTLA